MNEQGRNSPYLNDSNRLADVVAAIQAMGTYKFYKLSFDGWADRISGDGDRGDYWKTVFSEHPEFFRFDGQREKVSLVWRRQYRKRFHVDKDRTLTELEYDGLTDDGKSRLSRDPLDAADIRSLIDTAINMHSRAIEHQQQKRWWTALASGVGGLIGAAIGALFKS